VIHRFHVMVCENMGLAEMIHHPQFSYLNSKIDLELNLKGFLGNIGILKNIHFKQGPGKEERCSNVYQVGSLGGFLCVTFWIVFPKFPKYFENNLRKKPWQWSITIANLGEVGGKQSKK